jgi:hypothetical protein
MKQEHQNRYSEAVAGVFLFRGIESRVTFACATISLVFPAEEVNYDLIIRRTSESYCVKEYYQQ